MARLTAYNPDSGEYELANDNFIKTLIQEYGAYEDYLESLSFGKMLAHARRMKGLSQKELAGKLKVTQNTVSYLETDRRRPAPAQIELLSIYLDFSFIKLLSAYRKSYYVNLDTENLGLMMKAERESMGYSLEVLANQSNIPIKRLRRFESNKAIPNWNELNRIAKICLSDRLLEKAKRMFEIDFSDLNDALKNLNHKTGKEIRP